MLDLPEEPLPEEPLPEEPQLEEPLPEEPQLEEPQLVEEVKELEAHGPLVKVTETHGLLVKLYTAFDKEFPPGTAIPDEKKLVPWKLRRDRPNAELQAEQAKAAEIAARIARLEEEQAAEIQARQEAAIKSQAPSVVALILGVRKVLSEGYSGADYIGPLLEVSANTAHITSTLERVLSWEDSVGLKHALSQVAEDALTSQAEEIILNTLVKNDKVTPQGRAALALHQFCLELGIKIDVLAKVFDNHKRSYLDTELDQLKLTSALLVGSTMDGSWAQCDQGNAVRAIADGREWLLENEAMLYTDLELRAIISEDEVKKAVSWSKKARGKLARMESTRIGDLKTIDQILGSLPQAKYNAILRECAFILDPVARDAYRAQEMEANGLIDFDEVVNKVLHEINQPYYAIGEANFNALHAFMSGVELDLESLRSVITKDQAIEILKLVIDLTDLILKVNYEFGEVHCAGWGVLDNIEVCQLRELIESSKVEGSVIFWENIQEIQVLVPTDEFKEPLTIIQPWSETAPGARSGIKIPIPLGLPWLTPSEMKPVNNSDLPEEHTRLAELNNLRAQVSKIEKDIREGYQAVYDAAPFIFQTHLPLRWQGQKCLDAIEALERRLEEVVSSKAEEAKVRGELDRILAYLKAIQPLSSEQLEIRQQQIDLENLSAARKAKENRKREEKAREEAAAASQDLDRLKKAIEWCNAEFRDPKSGELASIVQEAKRRYKPPVEFVKSLYPTGPEANKTNSVWTAAKEVARGSLRDALIKGFGRFDKSYSLVGYCDSVLLDPRDGKLASIAFCLMDKVRNADGKTPEDILTELMRQRLPNGPNGDRAPAGFREAVAYPFMESVSGVPRATALNSYSPNKGESRLTMSMITQPVTEAPFRAICLAGPQWYRDFRNACLEANRDFQYHRASDLARRIDEVDLSVHNVFLRNLSANGFVPRGGAHSHEPPTTGNTMLLSEAIKQLEQSVGTKADFGKDSARGGLAWNKKNLRSLAVTTSKKLLANFLEEMLGSFPVNMTEFANELIGSRPAQVLGEKSGALVDTFHDIFDPVWDREIAESTEARALTQSLRHLAACFPVLRAEKGAAPKSRVPCVLNPAPTPKALPRVGLTMYVDSLAEVTQDPIICGVLWALARVGKFTKSAELLASLFSVNPTTDWDLLKWCGQAGAIGEFVRLRLIMSDGPKLISPDMHARRLGRTAPGIAGLFLVSEKERPGEFAYLGDIIRSLKQRFIEATNQDMFDRMRAHVGSIDPRQVHDRGPIHDTMRIVTEWYGRLSRSFRPSRNDATNQDEAYMLWQSLPPDVRTAPTSMWGVIGSAIESDRVFGRDTTFLIFGHPGETPGLCRAMALVGNTVNPGGVTVVDFNDSAAFEQFYREPRGNVVAIFSGDIFWHTGNVIAAILLDLGVTTHIMLSKFPAFGKPSAWNELSKHAREPPFPGSPVMLWTKSAQAILNSTLFSLGDARVVRLDPARHLIAALYEDVPFADGRQASSYVYVLTKPEGLPGFLVVAKPKDGKVVYAADLLKRKNPDAYMNVPGLR